MTQRRPTLGNLSVEDIRWLVNGHHEGSWDADDPACGYYLGTDCSCDYTAALERANAWLDEQERDITDPWAPAPYNAISPNEESDGTAFDD